MSKFLGWFERSKEVWFSFWFLQRAVISERVVLHWHKCNLSLRREPCGSNTQTEMLMDLLGAFRFFSSLDPRCTKWVYLKRWEHHFTYPTDRSWEPWTWRPYGRPIPASSPWQWSAFFRLPWGDEGPVHGMQTPVASDKCRCHRCLMVAWCWGGTVSNKLL